MRRHSVLSAIVLPLLAAAPAAGQSSTTAWQAFIGCWQPMSSAGVVDETAGLVCVSPNEQAGGVDVGVFVDGQAVEERTIIANGQRLPAVRDDCEGWESARWSEDGFRLFMSSELDCANGLRRFGSGVITLDAPDEWLDVQSVLVGGARDIAVRRMRPAEAPAVIAAVIQASRGIGSETARLATPEPLSIEDVIDASAAIERETIEALLIERGATFDLDAEALIQLADNGVEPRLIDLMVALSFPDDFDVNVDARVANPAAGPRRGVGYEEDGRYANNPFYGRGYSRFGYFYDPFYSPFYYSPFSRPYSPYDYYGGWSTRGPVVIIREPRPDFSSRSSGRFVRGSGFVSSGPSSGTARTRNTTSSTSSGSSSSTAKSTSSSSAGKSSGSSSSGRTAKKKGGG